MDLQIMDMTSVLIKIVFALIVGGLLGMERGRKNRPAGFRTYMLVCLGSTLVMMTNLYIFELYGLTDPVRMGSQVISGIGFLGAGTILITGRNQVKGITTAAGLWTSACLGLAIGSGFYIGAILGGIAIFLVMSIFQRIDAYIHRHSAIMDIYLEYDLALPFSNFLEYARAHQFEISDLQINKGKGMEHALFNATLTLESLTRRTHEQTIEILSEAPGIKHIEEI